ncbi:MAG TPA: hypothetical protein VF943_01760 [Burkholderiales bacterium]
MKALLLLVALAAALPARADLYRWIDPETGSVKLSNLPPPWFGDAEREARSPKVDVISGPSQGAPAPAERPAAARTPAALEANWRVLLRELDSLPQRPEVERSALAIQQKLRAYEALRAELDRADPAGATRRRPEETPVLERLIKGLQEKAR